jgi:hypothetical protein
MATLSYDPSTKTATGDFDVIPPGWYPATITAEEVKTAKSGNGDYLQLELTVTGDMYAGRKCWWRFNLWNSNPTAVEIANKELAGLLGTLNMPANCDSSQLVGAPIEIKVHVRSSEQYGEQNDIKGCRAPGQVQIDIAPASAPAAPKQATAPWAK